MLLFLTICFVTPSLANFCQKIIFFLLRFLETGLISLPPIWTMFLNILLFFRLPLRGNTIISIVCVAYLNKFENMQTSVRIHELLRLCQGVKVPVYKLCHEVGLGHCCTGLFFKLSHVLLIVPILLNKGA